MATNPTAQDRRLSDRLVRAATRIHVREILTGILRRKLRWPVILCLSVVAMAIAATEQGFSLEESALAELFRLRGPVAPPEQVVIVGLNKSTAEAFAELPADREDWPATLRRCDQRYGGMHDLQEIENFEWLPRGIYACVADILKRQGAPLVAFDVFFKESSRRAPGNDALIESFADHGRVLSLSFAERVDAGKDANNRSINDSVERPDPSIADATIATAPFVLPRPDGPTLAFWTKKPSLPEPIQLPLAAITAWHFDHLADFAELIEPSIVGAEGDAMTNYVSLLLEQDGSSFDGQLAQFADQGGNAEAIRQLYELHNGQSIRYLSYYGPSETIQLIQLHELLFDQVPAQSLGNLRDAAVFVGYHETRRSQDDDTFHAPYAGRLGTQISGVEIAATAFANLRDGQKISTPIEAGRLAIVGAITAILTFFCMTGNPYRALMRGALAALAYAGLVFFAFREAGYLLPVAGPLLFGLPMAVVGSLIVHYVSAKSYLQAYAGAPISDLILSGNMASLEGADPEVSILMTDIVNYSGFAERQHHRDVNRFIRRHIALLINAVRSKRGNINQFQGDAIMAVWGAPVPEAHHAYYACQAAQAIARVITAENARLRSSGLETIRLRIGINTGHVSSGQLGNEERMTFTVVGDEVNATKRIEELGKSLCDDAPETAILVSETTAKQAGDSFHFVDAGLHTLRGMETPMRIYRMYPQ